MGEKVKNINSKTVYIVSFGSEDNTDLLSDRDYKELLDKLNFMRPEDISALPVVILGSKNFRLKTQRLVLTGVDRLTFVKGRSKKAPENLEKDVFYKRAATQLELLLDTGKPLFVLLPFYLEVQVSKVG